MAASAPWRSRDGRRIRPFAATPPEVVSLIVHWTDALRVAELARIEQEEKAARRAAAQAANPFGAAGAGLGGLFGQPPPGDEDDEDEDEDEDDESMDGDMPPLEPIDGSAIPPPPTAPAPAVDDDDEDEAMPPLMPLDGAPVAVAPPTPMEVDDPPEVSVSSAVSEAGSDASMAVSDDAAEVQQALVGPYTIGSMDVGEDEVEAPYPSEPTFVDGLPTSAFVPLALVSRAFLHAVRSRLYTAPVKLENVFHATLFARTVLAPPESLVDGTSGHPLRELVRELKIGPETARNHGAVPDKPASLGRGGTRVVFELLGGLPNLRSVAVTVDMLKDAERVFDRVLADGAMPELRELCLSAGGDNKAPFTLPISRVTKIAEAFPQLRRATLRLVDGPLSATPSTPIKWAALTSLALDHADIDDLDVDLMMQELVPTLRSFKLSHPTEKLTRSGLEQIFMRHGSRLRELQLNLTPQWHPRFGALPTTVDADGVSHPASALDAPFILDCLAPHLTAITDLNFSGPIATTHLFDLLPSTLVRIKWRDCPEIRPLELAKKLRVAKFLPALKTVDPTTDAMRWKPDERKSLDARLDIRGAKLVKMTTSATDIFQLGGAIPIQFDIAPIVGGVPMGPGGAAAGPAQGAPQFVQPPMVPGLQDLFTQLLGGLQGAGGF